MDKMTIISSLVDDAASMREPTEAETGLGLWVDRTGESWDGKKPRSLRRLNNYGLLEVIEGTGVFYSEPTGWREVRTGWGFWLFPEIPHHYQADTEWHTRWIVFNGPVAEGMRRLGYIDSERALLPENGGAIGKAHRALSEIQDAEPEDKALYGYDIMVRLMAGLHRLHGGGAELHPAIGKVKKFIRDNCTSDISPEELAERFGISYSHLRKIFREQAGRSVKEYITRERMARAKTLLLDTNLPPKQIAEEVGYEDYLYFMRVFKKTTGTTAGEFRRGTA